MREGGKEGGARKMLGFGELVMMMMLEGGGGGKVEEAQRRVLG